MCAVLFTAQIPDDDKEHIITNKTPSGAWCVLSCSKHPGHPAAHTSCSCSSACLRTCRVEVMKVLNDRLPIAQRRKKISCSGAHPFLSASPAPCGPDLLPLRLQVRT